MWTLHDENSLRDEIGRCYYSPERYVEFVFPWGQGPLKGRSIKPWQRRYLRKWGQQIRERNFDGINPVMPIRFSTVSGHGVGKTAISAWIIKFLHDTRPDSKGTVTANTGTQLSTKTWAEVGKWHNMSLTKHWSEYNRGAGNMRLISRFRPDTWRVQAFTARKEMAESFQGQHADGSSSFYVFDEASAIPKAIYEAAYGGLVRGEAHFHEFGNGTQASGEFYLHHHRMRKNWTTMNISSIDVEGRTPLHDEWIDTYGYDSDFVKVRILGQFPSSGSLQYIPTDWVERCMNMKREVTREDPLVFGIDVAREGDDFSVIYPRRGRRADGDIDKIDSLQTPDTTVLAMKVIKRYNDEQPDGMFIDGGGIGGPVADMIRRGGVPIVEVNGAHKSPSRNCANMRSFFWSNLREAIRLGIALPQDDELKEQIIGVQYGLRLSDNAIQLERKSDMKARGLASPDKADALGMTYAYPVNRIRRNDRRNQWEAAGSGKAGNIVTDHESWWT